LNTEGKNVGLQHGAAALIGLAQPTDQLAVRQGQLIDGIHLPDGVDGGGAVVVGGAAAARGGGQPGGGEPAADGLDGGSIDAGMLLAEDDPDKPGAPVGVIGTQRDGTGVQGVLVGRWSWAGGVGRRQSPASRARLAEQSADGAWWQAEAACQGSSADALNGSGDEGVTRGQRDRSRHGKDLPDCGWDIP